MCQGTFVCYEGDVVKNNHFMELFLLLCIICVTQCLFFHRTMFVSMSLTKICISFITKQFHLQFSDKDLTWQFPGAENFFACDMPLQTRLFSAISAHLEDTIDYWKWDLLLESPHERILLDKKTSQCFFTLSCRTLKLCTNQHIIITIIF